MRILSTLLLLVISVSAFAQHGWGQLTANYPDDAPRIAPIQLNERGGNLKVIPVVVHVIHNYGDENISDEQVQSAIDQLNADFSAADVDINEIASAFRSIVADAEIEFRLAKLDPEGNCTNGITRTVSPLTYGATDAVKDVIGWPRNMYLNIWVVHSLQQPFLVNSSYWPGTEPSAAYDGILYENTSFGDIGTSSGSISPAYVAGVYLNLLPVWGTTQSCASDDGVADTPNTSLSTFGCDTTQVSCGTLDNVQNIMDYSSCGVMFTEGQKARMHATLASSVSERDNLSTPANLVATGTNDGFSNACMPIAGFHASRTELCEGYDVDFSDISWNADITQWAWTFEGGTPATSTVQNPTVTYASAGTYDVSLTVTSAAGSDSYSMQDLILVKQFGNGTLATITEGFELETFPVNTNPELTWSTPDPNGYVWERNTDAFVTGNASARVDLESIAYGVTIDMVSPPLDFSWVNTDNSVLTFDLAYALDGEQFTNTERLRVLVSKNCGESWITRYSKQGSELVTNGGSEVSSDFVPTSTEWRTETVTLGPLFANESNVLIRFEALSNLGNKLYIDNINIAQGALGLENLNSTESAAVYPNPINENSVLELNTTANGNIDLILIDALGKRISTLVFPAQSGNNLVPLTEMTEHLPAGIYILSVNGNEVNTTLKLIVR